MQGGNKTSAPLEGLSDIKSPKTVLNSPRQSNFDQPVTRIEDEKKFQHVFRRIFIEPRKLTEGAMAVCRDLHINVDDMFDKSMEEFEKELGKKIPKEIVELRYNHYQHKRRKNFETIGMALGVLHHHLSKQSQPQVPGGTGIISSSRWKPYTLRQGSIGQTPTGGQHQSRAGSNGMNQTQALPNIRQQNQYHLQINLGGGNGEAADTESHHSNAATKKIGKAQFFSPTAAQATTNKTFRSTLTSPDNAARVTQTLMHLQSRISKEAQRVERLKQVKQNSMQQVELELQKIHQRIAKDQKKQVAYQKHQKEAEEVEEHKREKYHTKRSTVLNNFNSTMNNITKKSINGFQLNIKEVEQLQQKKREKDRQHSQRHFEYLKHKIEDEEGNAKKREEEKRHEEEKVILNLSAFERKMSRGAQLADLHKRDTSSRASRTSSHQEDALRSHHSQWESEHTRSLQSIIKKTSLIDSRRKKANDSLTKRSEHVRDKLSLRFERNHSARSTVEEEHRRKDKLTMDRWKMKERLRDIIIEKQQIEVMKAKEINQLKRADHQDAVMKERAMLKSFKEKVARKYMMNDSIRKDLQENIKLFYQQNPLTHQALGDEERHIARLKPMEIINRERLNLTLQLSDQLSPAMKKKMRLQALKDAENALKQ